MEEIIDLLIDFFGDVLLNKSFGNSIFPICSYVLMINFRNTFQCVPTKELTFIKSKRIVGPVEVNIRGEVSDSALVRAIEFPPYDIAYFILRTLNITVTFYVDNLSKI